MTADDPDRHQCVADPECPRPAPEPGGRCWHHDVDRVVPVTTPLGRRYGLSG